MTGERPVAEYRCERCAYGAATSAPPQGCPLCGSNDWTRGTEWTCARLHVRRLGASAFLLTPPGELDSGASMLLAETVAALAEERPEIVVDLTVVETVDDAAARLLLQLGALAHGSGGRLLAVCPGSEYGRTVELHELDLDGLPVERLEGAVGRALRSLARRVGVG